MKVPLARGHRHDDCEVVSKLKLNKTFPSLTQKQYNSSFQETACKQKTQPDLEIERSLYYLGRALYRLSLLQQERRAK